MLDLLLLAVISFLVARVIWNGFGIFQRLFAFISRKPTITNIGQQRSTLSTSDKVENKKQAQKRNVSQSDSNKKSQKEQKQLKKSVSTKQGLKEQPKIYQDLANKQQTKLNQSSKFKAQTKEDLFPIRLQQVEVQQQNNSKSDQEATIRELREQISLYQKEKQLYIQRIEEIIQHIVNGTEQQSLTVTEESQPSAIHHLKNELNAAHYKIRQQKDILTKKCEQEKQLLKREYQQKLLNIQLDINQKTKLYEATINEITQRVQQMQTRGGEQKIQQTFTKKQVEEQHKKQQHRQQVQSLNAKIQELIQQRDSFMNKHQQQIAVLIQGWQRSKIELKNIRQELAKSQNDHIEYKTKYEAQIDSLQKNNNELSSNMEKLQKKLFTIEQQNEELKSKLHSQQFMGQSASKQLAFLGQKLAHQVDSKQQLQRKLQQTLDELRFCQQQLTDLKQTQNDLKQKLRTAIESPKKERSNKKEDIESSPQYTSMKLELQRLKRKLAQKQQIISRSKTPENQQREVSPSFAQEAKTPPKRLIPSPLPEQRRIQQTSPYPRPVSTRPSSNVGSTILASERRSTPVEKQQGPVSTIIEGGNRSEVYLGETQILNEAQRNIIVHEVSAVKKITVKKTRLMFSSRQKSNKSIHEFILGAPNIILVAELQNGKIVGAFTQNAFSKENKFTKSSIVSKAMIFDVSQQVFITNEGQGEIIRCQENALIWGNKEFVVNCQEPISISVDLNCEEGVYPSNYSTVQFLGSEENVVKVSKLQIHRVFLG